MRPAIDISAPQRPSWLVGLVLALVGFAVWTAFSLWPAMMQPGQPFRIREAWDTAMFWRVGVPLMLLAQAIGGALVSGGLRWQPLWMICGLFAGVLLVHRSGVDLGMFPLTVIRIGGPSYIALLAAAAIGRAAGEHLAD
ncbi:hypothetical protein ES707_10621 [subsurface metagenome]|jgi:hypothetical protein